jgi:hypothetical protein
MYHIDVFVRQLLISLRPNLDEAKLPLLIFVNKGIEIGTNALTLEIIADTCGRDIALQSTFIVRFLSWTQLFFSKLRQSGPSFAKESMQCVLEKL